MDKAFNNLIADVLNLARQPIYTSDQIPEGGAAFSVPALMNLIQVGYGKTPPELDEAIQALIPGLNAENFYHASRIAQIIGMFVELGGKPDIALSPLLSRLEEQLIVSQRYIEKPSNPILTNMMELSAWRGLTMMTLPAMTMLALSIQGRQVARQRAKFREGLEALRDQHEVCMYLSELLATVDDLKILVLEPDQRKGYWIKLEAVRNNFHLFTLLQCTLHPNSPANAAICAAAKGEEEMAEKMSDHALYNYCAWYALDESSTLNPVALIWGEVSPADIPRFEDTPVILLGPVVMRRGWDGNFFASLHGSLRSRVIVTAVLETDEVDQWLQRILNETKKHPQS